MKGTLMENVDVSESTYQAESFAMELSKSFAYSFAASAGLWAGILAASYLSGLISEKKHARNSKKTSE